jgi:hypothetical protein
VIRSALLRLAGGTRADPALAVRRARLAAWAGLVVAVLAGQIVWIVLLRGGRILQNDTILVMGQLLVAMGLIGISALIATTPPDAIRLSSVTSSRVIVGGTIVLQLLGVAMLWPAMSDDLPRYRLEGLTWLHGRSPYVTPPLAVRDSRMTDGVDRLATRRGQRSFYPPVAQTIFIAARGLELSTVGPANFQAQPDQPIRRWRDALPLLTWAQRGVIFRLFGAAAAIGCAYVLVRILESRGVTTWLAVLLAWNPLLLLEAAGAGHIDVAGILLILLMFRMLQNGRPALATLALCLACGIKPTAVLLAPLLVRQIWLMRDWRHAQRSIGMVVMTLVLVYLPILSVQGGLAGWLSAMQNYAQTERGNGGLFTLLGEASAARMLPPIVAIATLLWVLRRRMSMEDAAYWLLLATLLVSPRAMPQMVLWPLCLVPLIRHGTGWTALAWSGTVAFAYVMWRHPAGALPGRILAAEYLPVVIAAVVQASEFRPRRVIHAPADATSAA